MLVYSDGVLIIVRYGLQNHRKWTIVKPSGKPKEADKHMCTSARLYA